MKQYVLKRTLPDGTVRRHSPQATIRITARSAGQVLSDNARVAKAEAQKFSVTLAGAKPEDEVLHISSGYRFVIETVTEES